jgi:hypothetical protein
MGKTLRVLFGFVQGSVLTSLKRKPPGHPDTPSLAEGMPSLASRCLSSLVRERRRIELHFS